MWKRGIRQGRVHRSLLMCSKLVGTTILNHRLQSLLDNTVVVASRTLSIGYVLVIENLSADHAFDTFREILQNG